MDNYTNRFWRKYIMIKRLKVIAMLFVFVIMCTSIQVSADIPLRVVVNGEKIDFPDAQPFIDKNGRTQVPVRFVSEALGAQVDWNGNTKKVTVALNSRKVVLTIDKKDYEINGQSYQMDTVALLVESRTFVPIRFVSEALGAKVIWDQNSKTVYINLDPNASPAPIPSATPQGSTVAYYDGIAFNNVTDVDKFGRINVEKAKEFVLKLANQLSFVQEDGKYYIKCDYPEIPEGYKWTLVIRIFDKDGTHIGYTPTTRFPGAQIPSTGVFKKEANLINVNNVDFYNIAISIDHLEYDNTGLLNIVYGKGHTDIWVTFVPDLQDKYYEDYTKSFDFNKMFQW